MKLNTLEEVLIDHLRDLYDAEKHLVKALPKMAKAADSEELAEAIRGHLEQTKHHVERLEQVFALFDEKPRAKACKAIRGLIEEGGEAAKDEGTLSDLAIIAAAQKVEHYEISAYGTAKAWAEKLGNQDAVDLLEQTLEEEKAADSKLTEVSGAVLESAPQREMEQV
ncbi:MAG: ferritin-like domain-containing protein [Bryobacteraceae bacterium]